ncbi:MAG: SDR family NAD(P)-dependent oxidoreductase [Proteobacteria bacterium]|nr:SDR family NAD(P)-dependent oxidoreductase [Pseudomonadota bacterium]
MARVFITGSADGLGQMAAELLVAAGHRVVLHARNPQRADVALAKNPDAEAVVVGDLSSIEQTYSVADEINRLGQFDAVIHNAGIGYRENRRIASVDGLPLVFAVNALAPYILTALIKKPARLVYLSSGMHHGAHANLDDLEWKKRSWNGSSAYAESKLLDVFLAFAVARLWPGVLSNAVEPGWVATRMGGPGAPDDLAAGPKTQVWLAVSNDPEAKVTGGYFYHKKPRKPNPEASVTAVQDRFLAECERMSGVKLSATSLSH